MTIPGYTVYEDGLSGIAPQVPCVLFGEIRYDYEGRSRGYEIEQDIILLVAATDPKLAVIDIRNRLKRENLPEAIEAAYPGKSVISASGPGTPIGIPGNYLSAIITVKEIF